MKRLQSHNPARGKIRRTLLKWLLPVLFGLLGQTAHGQDEFLIEGIFDTEFYFYGERSGPLGEDPDDFSTVLRVQLWSAYQLTSKLQIYALGEAEFDNLGTNGETEGELEQIALRYSSNTDPFYYIEAGKLLSHSGAASKHKLSTLNWLIGQPDIYDITYPWGVRMAGSIGTLDYRLAVLDTPVITSAGLPDPDAAFRPGLGFGLTPITGLRFGISYTAGPYLNRQLGACLAPGSGWRDFNQRILGFEFQFSRGYFELNGELIFSEYDVPFHSRGADGTGYYLEMKYTWTPRFYAAMRLERNKNPIIGHLAGPAWLARETEVDDLEVSLGYRFGPDTQIKFAYRWYRAGEQDTQAPPLPDGRYLAFQFSHHFDPKSWFVEKP